MVPLIRVGRQIPAAGILRTFGAYRDFDGALVRWQTGSSADSVRAGVGMARRRPVWAAERIRAAENPVCGRASASHERATNYQVAGVALRVYPRVSATQEIVPLYRASSRVD